MSSLDDYIKAKDRFTIKYFFMQGLLVSIFCLLFLASRDYTEGVMLVFARISLTILTFILFSIQTIKYRIKMNKLEEQYKELMQ